MIKNVPSWDICPLQVTLRALFLRTSTILSDILNRLEDFFDGKIDAKAVLDKYEEEGFDANQDFPGNFLWEELYQARDPSVIYVGNFVN